MLDSGASGAAWTRRCPFGASEPGEAGARLQERGPFERSLTNLAIGIHVAVAGYNLHHQFTGLLLVAAGRDAAGHLPGLDAPAGRRALLLFGAGLGMALAEWVYLMSTDGSNASYRLPVSLWGAVVLVGFACTYAALLVAARVLESRGRMRPGVPSLPLRS